MTLKRLEIINGAKFNPIHLAFHVRKEDRARLLFLVQDVLAKRRGGKLVGREWRGSLFEGFANYHG